MSGTGSRFVKKGYKEIKPLVPVFGKPIIEYIVEKFSLKDNFIFICREEHLINKELNLRNYLNSIAPNTTILSVENHKLGPVHSLIQIEEYIDPDEELIVNYCDFDWRWNFKNFKKWLAEEKPDAALCVYSGFQPHYINPAPYAHTRNDQHNVLEIREKKSFTNYREEEPAASGTFYFSSGKLLLDSCKWLVKRDETINGEFYVSLLFNFFPSKGMRTLAYFIKHFMQWGTPQDLEEYIFFAKKVPLNFKTNNIESPTITLMAGKGNRMKAIGKVKKPYLKINNMTLFQLCSKNIKSIKKNIFALNGDEEDLQNSNLFHGSNQVYVGKTQSSVETLSIAISKSELLDNEPILVLPCDASIDLDWEKLIEFYSNLEACEAIIFSFEGYPYSHWLPNQYGWLNVNKDNIVKDIGYKSGWNSDFSNPIITGYFWFPNIGELKENLSIFLKSKINSEKETSIDEFCQFLIENKKRVVSYVVDDFLCLGTSQEFRAYEYWLEANEISSLN